LVRYMQRNGQMHLRRASHYTRELRRALPAAAFSAASSRVLWLPLHLGIIALCVGAIASGHVPWLVLPLLSLVIGCAFAGITFLAHETLHGAVVRHRRIRYLVGWVGLLPFVASPRLWIAWHNRVHHGNANRPGVDPDANPTLVEYSESAHIRIVTDHFALGRGSRTGVIGLMIGFSVQTLQVLLSARKRGFLGRREHLLAFAETALGIAAWSVLAAFLGPLGFVFAFFVPVLVANTIVMAFIMTNHGLSPITNVNDPLVNALSVTAPRWVEWLTLGFGYHVEHHLFPSMSARHAPLVRDLVRARWPERYQAMPLWRALLSLHRTARVYETETTLLDPRSGRRWPTLFPRHPATPEASDLDAPLEQAEG
jgi:fatty acid desaturase